MVCSTSQRFRAKFLAHADTDRFPDTGICPHSQPDSYRDPERSDADQSQSDADSNSNSDRDSDPNAPGLSRSECHTNTNAGACVLLGSCCQLVRILFAVFEKRSGLSVRKSKTRQFCWRVLANCYSICD